MRPSLVPLLFLLLCNTVIFSSSSYLCYFSCIPSHKCKWTDEGDLRKVKCLDSRFMYIDNIYYGKDKELKCNAKKTGPYWTLAEEYDVKKGPWMRIETVECRKEKSCLSLSLISDCRGSKICTEFKLHPGGANLTKLECKRPDETLYATDPETAKVHKLASVECSDKGGWKGTVVGEGVDPITVKRGTNVRCVRNAAEEPSVKKLTPIEVEIRESLKMKSLYHLTAALVFIISSFFFAYQAYSARKRYGKRWDAYIKESKPYRPLPVSGRCEGLIEYEGWMDKMKKLKLSKRAMDEAQQEEEQELLQCIPVTNSDSDDDFCPYWVDQWEEKLENEQLSTAVSVTPEEWSCCSSIISGEDSDDYEDSDEEKEKEEKMDGLEATGAVSDADDEEGDTPSESFSDVEDPDELIKKKPQIPVELLDSAVVIDKSVMREEWAIEGVEVTISDDDLEQSLRAVARPQKEGEGKEGEGKEGEGKDGEEEEGKHVIVPPLGLQARNRLSVQQARNNLTNRAFNRFSIKPNESIKANEETGTRQGSRLSGKSKKDSQAEVDQGESS